MSATKPQMSHDTTKAPHVVDQIAQRLARRFPWRGLMSYMVVALIFFLLGIIPMWVKARQYAEERETLQQQLRLERMETLLAAAVIEADRGNYEPARQTASDFFSSLRSQIDRGASSDLTRVQRERVSTLLAERDDLITLLARSDPAVVSRLSEMYANYRTAMNDFG